MANMNSAPAREILERHKRIAWDIDGTLLGGPNSAFFRDYIQTHREHEHHLVTFRNPAVVQDTFRELARNGISHAHIASLTNCPPHLWRALASPDDSPNSADRDEALGWKGKVASGKRCTILVDDLADYVATGCARHGVEFLDANDSRCAFEAPSPILLAQLAPQETMGVLRIERNGRGPFADGTMEGLMISRDLEIARRVAANSLLYSSEDGQELAGFLREGERDYVPGWRFGFASMEQYRLWCREFSFRAALAERGFQVVLYAAPRCAVRIGRNMCAFELCAATEIHRFCPMEVG